jgi:hypothetical protein
LTLYKKYVIIIHIKRKGVKMIKEIINNLKEAVELLKNKEFKKDAKDEINYIFKEFEYKLFIHWNELTEEEKEIVKKAQRAIHYKSEYLD